MGSLSDLPKGPQLVAGERLDSRSCLLLYKDHVLPTRPSAMCRDIYTQLYVEAQADRLREGGFSKEVLLSRAWKHE